MRDLGLTETELGAPGFLPADPAAAQALLAEYSIRLTGGFTPIEAHSRDRQENMLEQVNTVAALLAGAGARFFITAAVMDEAWSIPRELDASEHRTMVETFARIDEICQAHGLRQVLHPHVQTVIETADDVNRVLDSCDVNWCLDTGHLAIGGVDPVAFARDAIDRVGHVHLKDVRLDLVPEVLRREKSLMSATQEGLFTRLGEGDVDIAGVVQALESRGYRGSYVIEQDTAVLGELPELGQGPVDEVRSSLRYLTETVAPTLAGVGAQR